MSGLMLLVAMRCGIGSRRSGQLRGRPPNDHGNRQADGGHGEHRMVRAVPSDEEDGDSPSPEAGTAAESGLCHRQSGSGPRVGRPADRRRAGAATGDVPQDDQGLDCGGVLVGGQSVEAVEQFINEGLATDDADATKAAADVGREAAGRRPRSPRNEGPRP